MENKPKDDLDATRWFAIAKRICVDPYTDAYFDDERRWFAIRDDHMFRDKNKPDEE